jgi:hypothetical protein
VITKSRERGGHSPSWAAEQDKIIIIIIIIMPKEQYIKRHDRVSAQLHFNVCKETRVKLDKKH